MEVSPELIGRVRPAVAAHTRRTPLLRSEWLSVETGAEVFLKCENLQITGSFKVRGALAHLSLLTDDERRRGVVASSAGNHGLGLAHAARIFGVACTIVAPRSIPRVKEEAIRSRGARVVKSPHDGYDDTELWTREHLGELGGSFVSPFDDPAVMAGNGGTTAAEILAEVPDLDAIVIPCGGGGCSVGAGVAARAQSPTTRVIAINTEASPGMWRSRRDGRAHLKVDSQPTIAEGLEGGVSERSFRLAERYVDEVRLVSEGAIQEAVGAIARREHLVVEGSGAAGVAALLAGGFQVRRACVLLTGGNIDPERLASLLTRPVPR